MRANLDSTGGLIYTSAILLALVAGGMSREDAYALVQAAAMETWRPARRCGTRCARTRPARASRWTRPGWTRPAAPSRYAERLGGVFDRVEALAGQPGPGPGMRHLYSGKVRELYELPDGLLLLVATDRISAFDHVLDPPIPDKGKILTQLSLWWFGQLADLVPNHLARRPGPGRVRGPGDGLPPAVE